VKTKVNKDIKSSKQIHEQILRSMIASFKMEGINISSELAMATLKKVELTLEK
jgi:hypothetical protein